MRQAYLSVSLAIYCLIATSTSARADTREWTSAAGNFKFKGDVIAFSDELVVIKRESGQLQAVALKELSEEDRKFVSSKEVAEGLRKSADEMQTWTSKDGLMVEARVLEYGRTELAVQRKLGQVYINGKKFSEIDSLHQKLLLRILSHLEEKTFEDEKQLTEWSKSLGGDPKLYPLEGVLMELASGDKIGVPFFMFAGEDLEILQPGWQMWLERQESEQEREQASFLMRSAAMAYQQERVRQQQIQMLNMELLAAASGALAIFEVGLAPAPGAYAQPVSMMVPAVNSEQAVRAALTKFPGYQLIGVRRASRN